MSRSVSISIGVFINISISISRSKKMSISMNSIGRLKDTKNLLVSQPFPHCSNLDFTPTNILFYDSNLQFICQNDLSYLQHCNFIVLHCTVLNMLRLISTLLQFTLLYSFCSILSKSVSFCTSSPTCMHCSVQCLRLVAIATDPSQRSGPTLPNRNSNIMKAIS